MHDFSDMELVRQYARQSSEAAFAELVQRHVNLVYAAALRHTGLAAQAEEITQAVFILLARKAARLGAGTVVEAWLYETTRFTALSIMRAERRRQFREQEAYMQSTLQEPRDDPVWPQIAPLLDEAMMRLGGKEREAIVLRFFKDQSLRQAAAGLNVSEAAAQKRVSRALEKLRIFFAKRGVDSTAAIIAGAITANSVHAAPAALAKSVTAVAVAKGAAASTSTLTLVKGALKFMAWAHAKTTIAAGAAVILSVGTFAGVKAAAHLRSTAEDKQILTKFIAANRYWLLGPPESVTNYSYAFHLDWSKAPGGVIHTPVRVNGRHKASANERQAITYDSVLQHLARRPELAQIQSINAEEGKIRLTLKFIPAPGAKTLEVIDGRKYPIPPLRIDCGNGISRNWRGEFVTGATNAELVLDAEKMVPLMAKMEDGNGIVEESFDDYTEVTPGSYVPLTVAIKYSGLPAGLGTMDFAWQFKLHDNVLWLLDQSEYRGKKVAWTDQVAVNQPE